MGSTEGVLTTPQIAIQEASPLAQSPTDDETDIPQRFVDITVDELAMECRRHSAAGDIEDVDVALTQPLHSPDQPPDDVTDQGQEQPLSPTDYTLELDSEPVGCITADTSQQIFIEQAIEAAREPESNVAVEERPLSPTQYTLVDDQSDESSLTHVAQPMELPLDSDESPTSGTGRMDTHSVPGTNPH